MPKTILSTLHFLMTAVFGTQASYTTSGKRPWRIYEVNANELIIEVPFDILGTSNENASYLHGWSGEVFSGATTTVFTTKGDVRKAAVNVVGLGCSVFNGTAWEERTVSAISYNSSTDVTTITTAAYSIATPTSAPFFVTVPGDSVSSFRGDYLSPLWYRQGIATSVGANTLTDSGLTMTTNQYAGFFLRVGVGEVIFYPIVSNTATSFVLGANGGTPPLSSYVVVATPNDANETSDGVATPPHADRVYLTGDGKLEIVKEYLLEIVRASGVVLRIEKI